MDFYQAKKGGKIFNLEDMIDELEMIMEMSGKSDIDPEDYFTNVGDFNNAEEAKKSLRKPCPSCGGYHGPI